MEKGFLEKKPKKTEELMDEITPENVERIERLKRKTAELLDDPVFEDMAKLDAALEAGEVADAARVQLLEGDLDGLLENFQKGDVKAGQRLFEEWAVSEPGCTRLKEKQGIDLACHVIRNVEALEAKSWAVKILANLVEKGFGRDVSTAKRAVVAVGGAFCMDSNPETVLEATWILCWMARRHCWGAFFDMDLFRERLGGLLFDLTCSLVPDVPERARTTTEEALVAKLFELLWRMHKHNHTNDAFAKIYDQGHSEAPRRSVVTAAIEYVLDPRAIVHREDSRYRHDTIIDAITPSGLDSALRALYHMAELDVQRLGAVVDDQVQKDVLVYRLHRIADAVRTTRTIGHLESNEVISVTLALVQSMWPFHDFDRMFEKMEQDGKPFTGFHDNEDGEDPEGTDEQQPAEGGGLGGGDGDQQAPPASTDNMDLDDVVGPSSADIQSRPRSASPTPASKPASKKSKKPAMQHSDSTDAIADLPPRPPPSL